MAESYHPEDTDLNNGLPPDERERLDDEIRTGYGDNRQFEDGEPSAPPSDEEDQR